MNKIKKITLMLVSAFMSCILLGSVGCSCSKKKKELDYNIDIQGDVPGGIHDYDISETGEFLLKGGVTGYKIVIPQNSEQNEITASIELSNLFYEATGVSLEVVKDGAVPAQPSYNFISLGKTHLAESANISPGSILKTGGFIIRTMGIDIFIAGAASRGTLNGVYEFLAQILNYDFFAKERWSLDKNVKDIPLMNYKITDVPDIDYYQSMNAMLTNSEYQKYRMVTRAQMATGPLGIGPGHNTLKYFPKETYLATRPEYYAENSQRSQLCYTARGNDELVEEMTDIVVNIMKETVKTTNQKYISFACEDDNRACPCAACQAFKSKYGADSAAVVRFVNIVRTKLDDWFADTGINGGSAYDSSTSIEFYAYHSYEAPPSIYDEKLMKFVPTAEEMQLKKGITPFIPSRSVSNSDYTRSLYHEVNKRGANNIRGWAAIAQEVNLYYYDTNYRNYIQPYNSFSSIQENYKFAFENGSGYIYNLGQSTQRGHLSGFTALKIYLESKLGWNVNTNMVDATNNFFNGYFQDAALPMRKFYDEVRLHAIYLDEVFGMRGIFDYMTEKKHWPQHVLERWAGYCNEALGKIEYLKTTNRSLYSTLYKHIIGERIFPYYALGRYHAETIELDTMQKIRETVYTDANYVGMTQVSEYSAITSLWQEWGFI